LVNGKRRIKTLRVFTLALAALVFCMAVHPTAAFAAEASEALVERYSGMLNQLRTEVTAKVPKIDLEKAKTPGSPEEQQLKKFLASDALDAKLVKYVVLFEATPKGLAEFEAQGKEQAALIKRLLSDDKLMKQMVVADGAAGYGRGAPAAYGEAMLIYSKIQKASEKAKDGVLQRLALAGSVNQAGGAAGAIANVKKQAKNRAKKEGKPEVAVPEAALNEAVEKHYKHVVQHYMQYEKAYLGGELDPAFGTFTAWELGFVFGHGDPPGHLEWGREMLRNLRPDHIYNAPDGVRYSVIVNTCVKYGSGHVCLDRGEQFAGQNIIMNGGICGRRAGMGRYAVRCFGIPATHRPSPRHGALVRWSPGGWWPNLGPGWGAGYVWGSKDLWFREYTQAREDSEAFMQVKRAHWFANLLGEKGTYRTYQKEPPEGWYGAALRRLRAIVEANKVAPRKKKQSFSDIDEAIGPTLAQKVMAREITPADKEITYGKDGSISIPAAACTPRDATPCILPMKSFAGGLQIFMGRFGTPSGGGKTIVRGGGSGQEAKYCKSGWRMKDGNKNPAHYSYDNWGFRAAMTPQPDQTGPELTLELGDGVKLELVYIKPGTFVMGGENTWDNRFGCVEVPKHEVTITKGFYLGKYEVTQAQYDAMMGTKPGESPRDPNCPATTPGGITVGKAWEFCDKVADNTGRDARLPTEAEWEYACRAGSTTAWFFGDDPSKLGDYAWYKDNDGGKVHPVGQKKPNPWGLYDMCGSVFERVADIYSKDYYANSPKEDPTGPATFDGGGTRFRYTVNAPEAGKYTLSARVVTVNYNQNLEVSVNGAESKAKIMGPYTSGKWQDTEPVTIALKKGPNTLLFNRSNPKEAQPHPDGGPKTLHFQRAIAIKSFTLEPVRQNGMTETDGMGSN
jgi:formylglycine-generating enzyme required for sulfatase activity